MSSSTRGACPFAHRAQQGATVNPVDGPHILKAGGDKVTEIPDVLSAARRGIETEALKVKVEGAREGLFAAAEPADGTVGQHQFPNAMPSGKALKVPFRLRIQDQQVMITDGI